LSYGRKDVLITRINWGDWWGSNPRQPESQREPPSLLNYLF